MLAEDAFMRRLPVVLNPEQAVAIEAIVYYADVIEIAYTAIREIARSLGHDILTSGRAPQINLLMNSWLMIDSLQSIRTLLDSLNQIDAPPIVEFDAKYKVAWLLRRKGDHLRDQLNNLATREEPQVPLFGVLRYLRVQPDGVEEINGMRRVRSANAYTITRGRIRGNHKFTIVDPSIGEIIDGVGCFTFEAHGMTINLDNAYSDLKELLTDLDFRFEQSITRQAKVVSDNKGEPYENLMATNIDGFMLCASLLFHYDGTAEAIPLCGEMNGDNDEESLPIPVDSATGICATPQT